MLNEVRKDKNTKENMKVVIFINLEHFSWPTLELLFKLWKGKYWLEVRRELFVKKNTVMLT